MVLFEAGGRFDLSLKSFYCSSLSRYYAVYRISSGNSLAAKEGLAAPVFAVGTDGGSDVAGSSVFSIIDDGEPGVESFVERAFSVLCAGGGGILFCFSLVVQGGVYRQFAGTV